ncbi:MAG TPA: DMT family transporter [Stellaceae bacterium]|nr:DMT family transporter [Stellaceae bacterium]
MPGGFVVLWSTGFIGAKFGLPYAGPLTFLALRFGLVAALMTAVSLVAGAAWPSGWRAALHSAVVGLLIQGTYLGGVFFALAHGLSAGLSALVVGLQPALTAAVVGFVLGERVTGRQWLGFALGIAGTVLVVWTKLVFDPRQLAGLATVVAALLGMTIGTLYQKRFCAEADLMTATVIQNGTAGLFMLALALAGETMRIDWHPQFIFALAWLCLVLSVGATILFLFLLRRGAAARIASLFYLVPPVTAFMAYLLFGESMGPTALAGMALAVLGVALVNRG